MKFTQWQASQGSKNQHDSKQNESSITFSDPLSEVMRHHFYHSYKPTQIQRKGTETIPLIGRSVKELVAIGKKQANHARHS